MQLSMVKTNYQGININFLKFCLIILWKSVSTFFGIEMSKFLEIGIHG